MDINELIPLFLVIPQDFIIFRSLLVLTFFLHIIFVSLLIGSSLITLYINIISKIIKKDHYPNVAKDLSQKLPFILAFTVNLGVAPYLFLQVILGSFIYTSSIIIATYWLSLIFVIIIAYSLMYLYKSRFDSFPVNSKLFVTIVFSGLLIYTAFIFSGNVNLMLEPDKWVAYFNNDSGTFFDITNPVLYVRVFHFINGSVAIAGLFTGLVWYLKKGKTENYSENIGFGFRIFKHSTYVQIISGISLYFIIPEFAVKNLQSGFYIILTISIITIIAALALIFKERVVAGTIAAGITVFLMVILRDILRFSYLEMFVDERNYEVVKQVSPFMIFISVLLLCSVLMIFITKKAFKEIR
ncbi:MAG: hypothetical protein GY760_07005 [Deltaproteobacteria bacterium]|nr:hypothetical protein [Deltaproteobacteria bacterium]